MLKSKMYAVYHILTLKYATNNKKQKKKKIYFYKDAWYSCVENGCEWMDKK